jgi:hypothetical protein
MGLLPSRGRSLTAGFVGYIIGLGDRHGSNILVDQLTWGALHIDFGDVSHGVVYSTANGGEQLMSSCSGSHKNDICCPRRCHFV